MAVMPWGGDKKYGELSYDRLLNERALVSLF